MIAPDSYGPKNYYEKYNESVEGLKNRPELVELSKLCYETFYCNREGKVLLTKLNDMFLMGNIPQAETGDYATECIRAEAIRSVIRMFNEHVSSHKQRIQSEVNK